MVKKLITYLLAYVDPKKPFGFKLFNALARVTVTTSCEAVIFRVNAEGKTEVLLTQRTSGEIYAGKLHCPGSVMRPGEDLSHVFERISKNEIGTRITKYTFKGVISNRREKRGHFMQLIFHVELEGEPVKGKWYGLESLPENIIDFHRSHTIPMARDDLHIAPIVEIQ